MESFGVIRSRWPSVRFNAVRLHRCLYSRFRNHRPTLHLGPVSVLFCGTGLTLTASIHAKKLQVILCKIFLATLDYCNPPISIHLQIVIAKLSRSLASSSKSRCPGSIMLTPLAWRRRQLPILIHSDHQQATRLQSRPIFLYLSPFL